MKQDGFSKPCNDPALHDPKVYVQLVRRLLEAGVVDVVSSSRLVVEKVGTFTVRKKSGRQRLVIDARASNYHLREPGAVSLASGEARSRVEIGRDDTLFVADADISDAFYNMALAHELRPFFAMASLPAHRLGITRLDGRELRPEQRLWPRLAVLPMGWNQALELCQSVHEHTVRREDDISAERAITHRKVIRTGEAAWHTQYVDNFVALGAQRERVDQFCELAVERLRGAGLPVHEVSGAREEAEVLGWSRGGRVQASSRRLWRLKLATDAVLARNRASPRQVSRMIGHFTFVGLLKRPMLSVFDQVYHFARENDDEPKELPTFVSRELTWASALLPALWADLRSEWDPVITATDASEWAHGCTRRLALVDLVASKRQSGGASGGKNMPASRAPGAVQGSRAWCRRGPKRSWRQADRPVSQRCLTAWSTGPGRCRPAAGGRGPNTSSCLRGGVWCTGCGLVSVTRLRSGTACSFSATASSPSWLSARAAQVRRGSSAWPANGPRPPSRGAQMSGCVGCRRK